MSEQNRKPLDLSTLSRKEAIAYVMREWGMSKRQAEEFWEIAFNKGQGDLIGPGGKAPPRRPLRSV